MNVPRDILQGWTVLIVEDEPDSLDVALRVLRYYGATVYTAGHGAEALDVLRGILPQFIISDLSMPVMSGWDLIAELQRDRRLSAIPVIALTAHALTGDRQRAIAAGFHNYLTKPLTAKTFIADLLTLLDAVPAFAGQFHLEG